MATQISRLLEFAVRFAEEDFTHEREGDRLNWTEALDSLLNEIGDVTNPPSAPGIMVVTSPTQSVRAMTTNDLRKLQEETKALLHAAAVSRLSPEELKRFRQPRRAAAATHPFRLAGVVRALTSEASKQPFDQHPKPSFEVIFHVEEPIPAFLLGLALILKGMERLPLGICPEDWKLFYRVGRQLYCSRQCVLRANKRAWLRSRNKGKADKRGGKKK